jgi:hypothetical protein
MENELAEATGPAATPPPPLPPPPPQAVTSIAIRNKPIQDDARLFSLAMMPSHVVENSKYLILLRYLHS